MHKTFSSYIVVGVIGLFISIIPQSVFAARLNFKVIPNTVAGDNTAIIEVRIDPKSKQLNVVEGVINFEGAISDKLSVEIKTDGSMLTLWPTPPQYLAEEKAIRFVGGVPNGFDSEGLLFRLRLSSEVSGSTTISWASGVAYLNDGKGTQDFITTRSLSINLEQQKPNVYNYPSRFNWIKNVILILILAGVLFVIFKYGHKKIIKK